MFELLVALVLLGIVAAFVAPNLSTNSITVPAAATKLAQTIRLTQSLAMSRGQRYRIVFTPTSYQIADASGTPIIQPMTNSTAATSVAPISISGYNPPLINSYLAFDSRGVPYVSPTTALSSTLNITLTAGTESTTVVVSAETGRVR